MQLHAARGLNLQAAALTGRAQIDVPSGRLREVRGLHAQAACAELACGAVDADGRDAAAVDHFGRADLNAASRATVGSGVARVGGTGGVSRDSAGVLYPLAGRQDDASALLLQAMGLDAAAVFDQAAHQAVHGLRADDDQAARRLHCVAVVDQGSNLAGFNADVGQAVAGVKLQLHRLSSGQGHGAHLRDDGPLVAHLGGQQGDVATQVGLELAFVDHTGGAALALVTVLTRHEVGIADALGRGHQAPHVHPCVFAKVNAGRVSQHHLAIGADTAKNLAGVRSHDPVEYDAAGPRLLELHLGVLADIEGLPLDGGALTGLLNDHVGTALSDAGLPRADLAAGRQGCCGRCVLRVRSQPTHQASHHRGQFHTRAQLAFGRQAFGGGHKGLFAGVPDTAKSFVHRQVRSGGFGFAAFARRFVLFFEGGLAALWGWGCVLRQSIGANGPQS